MTTTRLSLYNGALLECGERDLASLSENREPRRLLDRVWDNGAVDFCLSAGQWRFAKRTLQLAPETSIQPDFGYRNAYAIPDDHIRTTAVCSDEYFNVPLTQYTVEQGFWFADISPLYVSYVSNDTSFGGDLSLWPQEFVQYVEAYLASKIVEKLSQNTAKWEKLYALVKRRKLDAESSDAMESPTSFPPTGSWVLSRVGRSAGRRDRGNRGSLIG